MSRRHVSGSSPWEERVGYRRAVRVGDTVHVSGTTGVDEDGEVVDPDDTVAQARRAFGIVADALEELGASPADVVRTRMYLVDVDDLEAVGALHREFVGEARPAATAVEVARLAGEDLRFELEVTAIVDGG